MDIKQRIKYKKAILSANPEAVTSNMTPDELEREYHALITGTYANTVKIEPVACPEVELDSEASQATVKENALTEARVVELIQQHHQHPLITAAIACIAQYKTETGKALPVELTKLLEV